MKKLVETIKGLEQYRDAGWTGINDYYRPFVSDALELLELLKAQEPNEDWISRKQLKNEIQYYIDEAGWGDEINRVLGWCLEFIDNQAEVKWA